MKEIISKELLSVILNTNVIEVYYHKNQGWKYKTKMERLGWVSQFEVPLPNIYELAHKCKEWAYEKKYYIQSYLSTDMPFGCAILDTIFDDEQIVDNNIFYADTEPEAIFKACQYILEVEHDDRLQR